MAIELAGLTRVGQGRTAEVFALDEYRVLKMARPESAVSLLLETIGRGR
jgi:hypothetical protein